jgi:hypothetical protein
MRGLSPKRKFVMLITSVEAALLSNRLDAWRGEAMSARREQTGYSFGRLRRALMVMPLLIVLRTLLLWTLAHTYITAFATVLAAVVIPVGGTFWLTRSEQRSVTVGGQVLDWRRQPELSNHSDHHREAA